MRASVWRVSVESDLLDRFDSAWRRFEVELRRRFRVPVRGRSDIESVLLEAASSGQLPRATVDFLQAARRVRNACAHVTFEDYAGPIAAVPLPVVHQLERLADFLVTPQHASEVAVPALICRPHDGLRGVLHAMREHDFSQLPYRERGKWLLVSRDQVARWVELEADAEVHQGRPAVALVDMSITVRDLGQLVEPAAPVILNRRATVLDAIRELEHRPITGAFGPTVLVKPTSEGDPPNVLTPADLPRLYDLVGR